MSQYSIILGHEGPGSSFAALQNEGLVTSVSSGPRVSGPDQTLFQLDVALTEQGEERWKEVVDLLMAHSTVAARCIRSCSSKSR
jgi:secreted Zn-dependent insulinase-like peptidase